MAAFPSRYPAFQHLFQRRYREDHPRGSHSIAPTEECQNELSCSIERGLRRTAKICRAITKLGKLDILRLPRPYGFPWDTSTCSHADDVENLSFLKWARLDENSLFEQRGSPLGNTRACASEESSSGAPTREQEYDPVLRLRRMLRRSRVSR